MPRQARVVADGVPHHITQRGNNRQEVFLLDEDRRFYLESLRLQARRHGVRLLGYCLMTNHVHLVAVPERLDGLALALGADPRRLRVWACNTRCPPLQPPLPAQRTPVAKPLLLLSAGTVAFVARLALCGFESRPSRTAERCHRVPLVERGRPCQQPG